MVYHQKNAPTLVLLSSNTSACYKMDAIGVEDACYLVKYAKTFRFKGNVNIHGTVIAVSEVFRVKEDFVILVKLKGHGNACVSVMVLHRKMPVGAGDGQHGPINSLWQPLQRWKEKLQINQKAVFTKLKLTVIFKGTDKEQTIFRTDTASACLMKENEDTYKDFTLEDWFYKYLRKIVSTKAVEVPSPDSVEPKGLKCLQGRVTSCEDSVNGVYELDKTKRLFLTRIPSETCFEIIRPGARISVSVHYDPMVFSEEELFFGCIHSSVWILEHPNRPSESLPFRSSTSSVASLLSTHPICNSQLYEICKLEHSIVQRFNLSMNRHRAGAILHSVLTQPLLSSLNIIPPKTRNRNTIAEFLQDSCFDNQDCGLPCTFPTIADILSIPMRHRDATPSDHKHGWSAKCFKSSDFHLPQVLLGVLRTNKANGHIELQDSYGHISAVISDGQKDKCHHSCSDIQGTASKCFCADELVSPRCFYAQTWLMEHLVRIDNYEIVLETFSRLDGSSDSDFTKCYVQFSAKDVLICDKVSMKSDSEKLCFADPSGVQKKERKQEKSVKLDCAKCMDSYETGAKDESAMDWAESECGSSSLPSKSTTKIKTRRGNVNSSCAKLEFSGANILLSCDKVLTHGFCGRKELNDAGMPSMSRRTGLSGAKFQSCSVRRELQPSCTKTVLSPSSDCEFLVICTKEGLQMKQVTPTSCELFFNITGFKLRERVDSSVGQRNANCNSEQRERASLSKAESEDRDCGSRGYLVTPENSDEKLTFERIALTVSGAQVKLFEVLHLNCLYRLTVNRSLEQKVFISNVPAALRGKSLRKTYTLNENCQVERLQDVVMSSAWFESINREEVEVLTVAELLGSRSSSVSRSNQGSSQALVTVRGVVKSKTLKTLDKRATNLQKKCMNLLGLSPSDSQITLTLSDPETSDEIYLGLPCGAHPYALGVLPGAVVIASQVRRRRINGFNCLQYVAVSNIIVLKRTAEIVTSSEKSISPPRMSLFQVWNVDEVDELQFQCLVFVSVVLKLSLDPVCMHCASRFHHGKCTGRGCGSNAGIIKPEALIIGDDGTCKGLIFCKGSSVQGLLGMSDEAWLELEDYLLNNGGFYYDKGNPTNEVTPVHQMLQESCNNGHLSCYVDLCLKPAVGLMRQNNTCKGLRQITSKDVPKKLISYSQTRFETHQLPMLKLDCLSIKSER